jgi:hypothetical protein
MAVKKRLPGRHNTSDEHNRPYKVVLASKILSMKMEIETEWADLHLQKRQDMVHEVNHHNSRFH